jgi:hypothetical protein
MVSAHSAAESPFFLNPVTRRRILQKKMPDIVRNGKRADPAGYCPVCQAATNEKATPLKASSLS